MTKLDGLMGLYRYFSRLCLVQRHVRRHKTGCVFKPLFICMTRNSIAFFLFHFRLKLSSKLNFLNVKSQFLHRKQQCVSFARRWRQWVPTLSATVQHNGGLAVQV